MCIRDRSGNNILIDSDYNTFRIIDVFSIEKVAKNQSIVFSPAAIFMSAKLTNKLDDEGKVAGNRVVSCYYGLHSPQADPVLFNFLKGIDFKKIDIKSILKIVGSDECLSLKGSPLIALLHQIGKCNMLRPICLDEKVVSKMIKSFPVRFSGKHIGNACYGLQNLDPTQESTKALVSAIAEKVRNSPPSVELNAQEIGNACYLSLIHISEPTRPY